ncbi:chemotaxis protein CheB [Psychroserpens sp. Hel_I_66]|uniref:chemotaxis protein CheB n=1 Tax=Psychroserpens sp. Hel_I_66 TaxID=1250004 RepID=UPI0006480B1D|nr:chemotaxis protein CheB [Psychroserpens sp. Hel_I_66]
MGENFRLFVIGASAGGYRAIKQIVSKIPLGLDAAYMIVLHSAFDSSSSYAETLGKFTELDVVTAEHKMKIRSNMVIIAKPNYHLFIHQDRVLLSKGPRENLFRPSIDVLFRSAAVAFKNKCVGVLLTGRLNDGTSGLSAIQRCGGLTIIENPETAEFSSMPSFANQTIDVDYIVNLEDMADVIISIHNEELPIKKEIPLSIVKENDIAMRIKSQIELQEELGEQVPISCASCGGPLWQIKDAKQVRYRCHVGHAFTQEALLRSQDSALEEALWLSIRTLEEKRTLMQTMLNDFESKKMKQLVKSYTNKIEEVSAHIKKMKSVLQIND